MICNIWQYLTLSISPTPTIYTIWQVQALAHTGDCLTSSPTYTFIILNFHLYWVWFQFSLLKHTISIEVVYIIGCHINTHPLWKILCYGGFPGKREDTFNRMIQQAITSILSLSLSGEEIGGWGGGRPDGMIFTGHIPLHPHTPTYVTLRHQAGCVEVEFVFEEKQDTSKSPYIVKLPFMYSCKTSEMLSRPLMYK